MPNSSVLTPRRRATIRWPNSCRMMSGPRIRTNVSIPNRNVVGIPQVYDARRIVSCRTTGPYLPFVPPRPSA